MGPGKRSPPGPGGPGNLPLPRPPMGKPPRGPMPGGPALPSPDIWPDWVPVPRKKTQTHLHLPSKVFSAQFYPTIWLCILWQPIVISVTAH